jgi:uncharacterized damage-inducible protein DinB
MEAQSNDITIIKYLISSNYKVISMNINDISNEESMIFPNGDANCMNWILGHIIYIRNAFLNVLGEESVWDNDQFSCYNRGEIPLDRKNEFVDFEELKTYLKASQSRFETKLNTLESIDPVLITSISGLCLHEIYHNGQLGYLRRFLGKPGAVK